MTDKDFHRILKKYLQGRSTTEEERVVETFYRQNKEKTLLDDYSPEEEKKVRDLLLSNVMTSIHVPVAKPRQHRRIFLRVAATFILLAVAGALWWQSYNSSPEITYLTKTTARGQRATITLSDGSTIRLNAESSVTFPSSFANVDSREISLEGEAFFDVNRNPEKPFIVQSGSLNTTVLGTSFNINAYPEKEEIRVTVATGKVGVSANSNSLNEETTVLLEPGEQATFNKANSNIALNTIELEKFLGWKDDVILFDDIPLSEAISILERWFNVEIELERPELGACFIEGSYKGEQLINILESMEFVNGVAFEFLENGKVLITGNACNN